MVFYVFLSVSGRFKPFLPGQWDSGRQHGVGVAVTAKGPVFRVTRSRTVTGHPVVLLLAVDFSVPPIGL